MAGGAPPGPTPRAGPVGTEGQNLPELVVGQDALKSLAYCLEMTQAHPFHPRLPAAPCVFEQIPVPMVRGVARGVAGAEPDRSRRARPLPVWRAFKVGAVTGRAIFGVKRGTDGDVAPPNACPAGARVAQAGATSTDSGIT